jgi:putative Mg2+ transporter-C (MgtC) family protein
MTFDLVDVFLRVGAATIAGVVIGCNRDMAGKSIGMRTLGLVSGSKERTGSSGRR